jgi:hypothetical protein
MDLVTEFNNRVNNVSDDWKKPLIEVIDTASAIQAGIQSELGVENPAKDCPDLLLALTKMAIERHDSKGSSSGIGF